MFVDEAAINKLVEERVAAILAQRETSQADQEQIQQRQSEDKRLKDSSLMRLAQSANEEPESGYGSGREFRRGRELSESFRDHPSVVAMAEQLEAEAYGGR